MIGIASGRAKRQEINLDKSKAGIGSGLVIKFKKNSY